MNDDDLDRLLAGAFDAQARAAVPDDSVAPPPRFAELDAAPGMPHVARRRTLRRLAPALAAAVVVAAVSVGALVATSGGHGSVASRSTHDAIPAGTVRAASDAQPVHVKLHNSDDQTYGVGMPVIAYFSRAITDARSLQKATTVTVNGKPLQTAWYFEKSEAGYGPLEAHLRPRTYWPADAKVHVGIAAQGVSAGKDLGFDNSLTLDFRTGARNMIQVDNTTHRLILNSNGKVVANDPVSLGAKSTPTLRGVKVIMDKDTETVLKGPGFVNPVRYVQRLTYGGEYLLAAPWNSEIGTRNTSEGSTNLTAAAAKSLYAKTRIGDVVSFPDATGAPMQLGAGYGDWNVTWGTWLTGGLVPTH